MKILNEEVDNHTMQEMIRNVQQFVLPDSALLLYGDRMMTGCDYHAVGLLLVRNALTRFIHLVEDKEELTQIEALRDEVMVDMPKKTLTEEETKTNE